MPENFYDNYYVPVPMEPRRDDNLKQAPTRANDDKFEDHPKWVEIQDVLRERLLPFAEARDAVVRGLDELFAGSSA